jgi:cell wall-associated NlpC family hydrolase
VTQIVIDLDELDQLIVTWGQAEMQLAGIVADVRRRVLGAGFDLLPPYGVDPSLVLADLESACGRLMTDTVFLEAGASELQRALWEGAQAGHVGLGPYSAALPDLWWFKTHATTEAASTSSGLASPGVPLTGTPLDERIVLTAERWEGIPYLWGGGHGAVVGTGLTEVDCSGLVHQVFGENGIAITGTAQDMYDNSTRVPDLAQAQPGDLLFWGTPDDIHHVAIYIGNDEMIEAPHTGAVVHVTQVYLDGFAGIGRILP